MPISEQAARRAVSEEIRRSIADAILRADWIRTRYDAVQIARAHATSGISPQEVADELIQAAIHAGVPVEISRPAA